MQKQSVKQIPLSDPLVKPIQTYISYLKTLEPKPKFFFPRIHSVFGFSNSMVPNEHISGRQVFNMVRSLSETIWLHLFRETVASDIIKRDSSIIAAFRIQQRLDLESYETGFHYLKRFAGDIIKREEQTF